MSTQVDFTIPCRGCGFAGANPSDHIYGERKCCPDCDHRSNLDLPALVSAEREADRLALVAAREEVARANAMADSMQHFADVAERVERVNNELADEVARLRAGIEAMSRHWATIPSLTREAHDAMLWASRELDSLLAGDL